MEMLSDFKCRRAETKTILVRGLEDGFSPAGTENGFRRPERRTARTASITREVGYDNSQTDGEFTDSILAPGNIADGLIVLGLKPLLVDRTDTLSIGNLAPTEQGRWGRNHFSSGIGALSTRAGWKRLGALYYARMGDVRFAAPRPPPPGPGRAYSSLQDYLSSSAAPHWIDVIVQDDTAVDFIGMAFCQAPARRRGLTLASVAGPAAKIPGVISLSCFFADENTQQFGLYSGDTACATRLPVACLRPGREATPMATLGSAAARTWTGGQLKLSRPVAGDQFARISDVDRFCAQSFGPDWRTAAVHDGLKSEGLTGRGDQKTVVGRVWVDIADQPYATCWRRG